MTTDSPGSPRGLRISDLVGLVVGYGLAALLCKSLWSASRPFAGTPALFLGILYAWLGLAMSGPILLPLERRPGGSRTPRPSPPSSARPPDLRGPAPRPERLALARRP